MQGRHSPAYLKGHNAGFRHSWIQYILYVIRGLSMWLSFPLWHIFWLFPCGDHHNSQLIPYTVSNLSENRRSLTQYSPQIFQDWLWCSPGWVPTVLDPKPGKQKMCQPWNPGAFAVWLTSPMPMEGGGLFKKKKIKVVLWQRMSTDSGQEK